MLSRRSDISPIRRRFGIVALILSALLVATPVAFAGPSPNPSGSVRQAGPHVMPMRTPPGQLQNHSTSPPNVSPAHLDYYGGRVVSNVKVVEVLWGSGTYVPEVQNTTTPSIASFYRAALANSFPFAGWLDSEYNTLAPAPHGHTSQHIGTGSFVGQVTITPSVIGTVITDSQIQSELSSQITAGHLPTPPADGAGNPNVYYDVYFPSGDVIQQGGSASCVPGGFLAYHGTVAATAPLPEYYYGVHPDLAHGGCAGNAGTGTAWGDTTDVSSHELVEMMTDPEVGIASVFAPPLGWYDQTNNVEIGDLCNNLALQRSLVDPTTGTSTSYFLQGEWSNAHNACYIADDFGLSGSTPAIVTPGSNATATISTTVPGGQSSQGLTLSATGLPTGATASFSPATLNSGNSSVATLHTAAGTAGGVYPVTVTGRTSNGLTESTTINLTVRSAGTFVALTAARLLDTRNGTGAPQSPVAANSSIALAAAGRGGVPATGVGAVVLNVTATNTNAPGYVAVYPTGVTPPLASNLNFVPGQTVPNAVTVRLGPNGGVNLLNGSGGSVDLVADVAGYYVGGTATQPGTFVPLTPARLVDTRQPTATVPAGGSLTVTVAGNGGVPVSGSGAAVLNVTATNPTAAGYLTVYPAGVAQPTASNLNFVAGQTVPNAVTVPEGTSGQIVLYNGSPGSVDLVVDVSGYYNAGAATLSGAFVPLTPARILDSRDGTGTLKALIGANASINLLAAGAGGVPPSGAGAIVMNTTVTDTTAPGYITVFPFGIARPLASNLNFIGGQSIPNVVTVPLGSGQVTLFNGSPGFVNLVGDVAGYFLA